MKKLIESKKPNPLIKQYEDFFGVETSNGTKYPEWVDASQEKAQSLGLAYFNQRIVFWDDMVRIVKPNASLDTKLEAYLDFMRNEESKSKIDFTILDHKFNDDCLFLTFGWADFVENKINC